MGVNKLYNVYQAGKQIAKTVKSPITHARNLIKATFKKPKTDTVTKYRKKALKMTKEATAKVGRDTKAAESRIGKEEAQKIGRETKSKMVKDFLKYNRDLKAKGGRAGYKLGKKVEKKNGKTPFGMLSVKAGIDKNPNPTQADRIAGAKMKNKKKVI
jgi:hypothetical protein